MLTLVSGGSASGKSEYAEGLVLSMGPARRLYIAPMEIWGEEMRDNWEREPKSTEHIRRWLAGNCFGDYYTRGGLDLDKRELATLCFLASQGGCDPQVEAHVRGNLNLGREPQYLIDVISQMVPYIGYPRVLNTIAIIEKVAAE